MHVHGHMERWHLEVRGNVLNHILRDCVIVSYSSRFNRKLSGLYTDGFNNFKSERVGPPVDPTPILVYICVSNSG